MAVKPAPAKKSAPAKKAAAAKKAPAKTTAKKAAPAPKAGGRQADPEKVAARAAKAAEVAARREARESERSEQTARVVELRNQGMKWPEVAADLGISTGKAMLLFEYANAGTVESPTPAKVREARDSGSSWAVIMARFGFRSKSAAQKMYAETGADPHLTTIGKGGRYFSYEDRITRPTKATAPKAPKAPKATPGKVVFNGEEENDAIVKRVNGKTITVQMPERLGGGTTDIKVKPESVKVGRNKAGQRVVGFTDAKTGGARTVALDAILKVGR